MEYEEVTRKLVVLLSGGVRIRETAIRILLCV